MMGIAGLTAAEQAALLSDETNMVAIANTPRLWMGHC
jgi:hypothetical protein